MLLEFSISDKLRDLAVILDKNEVFVGFIGGHREVVEQVIPKDLLHC